MANQGQEVGLIGRTRRLFGARLGGRRLSQVLASSRLRQARAALEAQLRKEERRLARREARAALAATPEAKVKRLEADLLRRGAL